jgi:hypothetical protein
MITFVFLTPLFKTPPLCLRPVVDAFYFCADHRGEPGQSERLAGRPRGGIPGLQGDIRVEASVEAHENLFS